MKAAVLILTAALAVSLAGSCATPDSIGVPAAPPPAASMAVPAAAPAAGVPGGPREYETMELTPIVNRLLNGRGRDFARGEKIYMETLRCSMCHLFGGGSGGIGPDLSGVGGRFGPVDIIRSILEPDDVVSDLYDRKRIYMTDGTEVLGREITSTNTEEMALVPMYSVDEATMTAYWGVDTVIRVRHDQIAGIEDSKESLMPPGLINVLTEEEVADLVAFMISGGNPEHTFFKPSVQ